MGVEFVRSFKQIDSGQYSRKGGLAAWFNDSRLYASKGRNHLVRFANSEAVDLWGRTVVVGKDGASVTDVGSVPCD